MILTLTTYSQGCRYAVARTRFLDDFDDWFSFQRVLVKPNRNRRIFEK